jgi:orotate phosphoribosyltransferase
MRERLIALVRERSFLTSEEPTFLLSSGQLSKVYFDLRLTTLSPEGQHLIGNLILDRLRAEGLAPAAIGGLTMGADPVASAVAHASYLAGRPVEAFVIRKEPKAHGRGRQIEGRVEPGDGVVIVDDVLTTGGSTLKAVAVARAAGLKVLAAVVVLDRLEKDGRRNVEREGVALHAILTMDDFR